ncbi:DEAD-domain-containing protein [Pluteus cervinus]|uniref:DEAD-domain-containing protein n=1 Tax=Pluteus cervinus TaxID=181527 RepID=A0ACD3B6G0_9AGAR|nr:DEAD-domain-containing protein [Pluteus cervinus]
MDDGLVLNLATDDTPSSHKSTKAKKGGRWTDRLPFQRLKAKRTVKRKASSSGVAVHDSYTAPPESTGEPPVKRPRKEQGEAASKPSVSRPQGQIISSLFSSNPKVEVRLNPTPQHPSLPSNAPLADSSTFSGLGLDPLLVSHLTSKMKITKPTAIQRAALPTLLSANQEARDVFIQSQTGSGKTLSFLLPIIQDLLPLSTHSYIDRSIGTLAIIIAPTRELAKQISDVLEAILQMRLRPEDQPPDATEDSSRLTRWLVSGLLTGGSTRTHEKARLRKGVPILVSTPGRLLDHLQNSSSFNVGKCRWLVLDEADRLMDLGFEETIKGILQGLDGRRRMAIKAVQDGKSIEVGGWDWERRRKTILCSATIHEGVQKLAGTALVTPLMIKVTELSTDAEPNRRQSPGPDAEKLTPPSQLIQKFVVVPLKLRLVALVALLRSLVSQSRGNRGTKIIVFLSSTDSVDFHWSLLGSSTMDDEPKDTSDQDSDAPDAKTKGSDAATLISSNKVEVTCPLLPNTSIYRLHGSLPTQTRLSSLSGFVNTKNGQPTSHSSVLLCTSVASRGLDLPFVRAVIQYDLPTEGGATEYIHRIGRTARAGKGGEAWSIVAPSEIDWVKWVEERMRGDGTSSSETPKTVSLTSVTVEDVLKTGFKGENREYEDRATDVQLSFERWALRKKPNADMARKAYLSHIRAYATHPSNEKHIFHIRKLHLGHLAKAFALREAPTTATTKGTSKSTTDKSGKDKARQSNKKRRRDGHSDDDDVADAERRMKEVVRQQGRLSKKKGVMTSTDMSDFQIASGYDLEKMVSSYG